MECRAASDACASAHDRRRAPTARARRADRRVRHRRDHLQGPRRVITSWNLGRRTALRLHRRGSVGQPLSLIIPERAQRRGVAAAARALDGEHIDCYETTREAEGRPPVSVSLTLFALRDGRSEIVGGASIAHDISTQVAARRELPAQRKPLPRDPRVDDRGLVERRSRDVHRLRQPEPRGDARLHARGDARPSPGRVPEPSRAEHRAREHRTAEQRRTRAPGAQTDLQGRQ